MQMSHILLCMSFFVYFSTSHAQFFTKTGNSIPRMGRRADQTSGNLPMFANLVRRVARTLRFVIAMVEEYDDDANGELNPEELMKVPLIQNAVRNYIEERELRGQYPVTAAKEEAEPNKPYDQRLIM